MHSYKNSWIADVHTALPRIQKVLKKRGDYLLENDLRFHEDLEYRDAFAMIEVASLALHLEETGQGKDAKLTWDIFLIHWELVSLNRWRLRVAANPHLIKLDWS